MSQPPNQREQLLGLFGAIRDERITAEQFARLQQLLSKDAEARRLYIQFMTLHASLEQIGSTDVLARQVRQTLDDALQEETVRELRTLIAQEIRSRSTSRWLRSSVGHYLATALTAAAVILAAVYLGSLFLGGQDDATCSAEIAAVYGRVELSGVNGDIETTPGTVVRPGQSVTTGPHAYVRLRYADGTTIDLKAATEFALVEGSQGKRLELVAGSAYFDVRRQPAGAPLIVNPGRYDQVKVVGTSFEIRRAKQGETRLFVAGGDVLFGIDDKALHVEAEQQSVASPERKPALPEKFDRAALWQGLSRGLTATYYDHEDFTGASVTRVDPTIDFHWKTASPDPAIPADRFSARWIGRIRAEYSEPYTFYVAADEGARLWIDGRLLIDAWKNKRQLKLSARPMKLLAGRKYDVKLEYREHKGDANLQLWWSSPSTPKSIVPQSQLDPSP